MNSHGHQGKDNQQEYDVLDNGLAEQLSPETCNKLQKFDEYDAERHDGNRDNSFNEKITISESINEFQGKIQIQSKIGLEK